jgi:uncharacterized protein YndB with AHSA1/START domain
VDIVHEIDIATSHQRLYEALTTQAGLSGWYTPETTAAADVGAMIEFKFSTLTTLSFRVETLQPGRRVVWTGAQVPNEWKTTPITFDIRRDGDSVILIFRQEGFASEYKSYGGFGYCWGQYIRSLKLLLETGTGEPFGSPASIACGTTPAGVF